ncbi:MAG: micrococcal nuclease-like nuclease [Cyanobacteria bacterium]|jgi:micrococcal nuclease|nr:micrococcal nuclease-like nuclease [Cyanobacteria bacterium GSL.Bin21]
MIRQLLLLITVFLAACSNVSASFYPTVDVISVSDGDTITVKENRSKYTVRLACIEAPESSQDGGSASTNYLKKFIAAGKTVGLRKVTTDRSGRTVGEIYRNGDSLNLIMVQRGHAVVYDPYLDACSDRKQQFLEAEQRAKLSNLHFWSQPNVMPWEYRRGERVSSPNASNSESSNLPACIETDCNCSDFSNQQEAQRVLETFSGDPHRLHRDDNGVAGES